MSSGLVRNRAAPEAYLPFLQDSPPAVEEPMCSLDLVTALAAKGFVILTGPSGTGKSRAALRLGQSLDLLDEYDNGVQGSAYELVPVAADWTDTRGLLGYTNPFGPSRMTSSGETTNTTYEITPALRLLLRAASPASAGMPYMLILDEMNLSHVERYLSPILSLTEANRSRLADSTVALLSPEVMALIADVLGSSEPNSPEAEAARELVADGRGLPVPTNLLVIGTVNVDETTYMFSPKVLDRAHVLEIESLRPRDFFETGADGGADISAESALELLSWAAGCHADRDFERSPSDLLTEAMAIASGDREMIEAMPEATVCLLDGAYWLLGPVGFRFGYRAVKEVCAYLLCWVKAQLTRQESLSEWPEALDRAFVQKILPRVHGSRRQLGESLSALELFLEGHDQTSDEPASYRVGAETIGIEPVARFELPGEEPMRRSRAKLSQMRQDLQSTGYATFIR